ncbi:MAG: hypothetical protein ABJC19_07715 [Gemmatimonadota bacterium]
MRQDPATRTVGDTLTIVQRIRTVPGSVVQPRALLDSNLVTMLAPPSLIREGDSMRVAYRVAVWQAGTNELTLPGAVVVSPGGFVDTLPDTHVLLRVATVLPNGKAANTLAPRDARPVVPRGDRTLLPLAILSVLLLVLIGLAWRAWRKRGPAYVAPAPTVGHPIEGDRLERWLAAGEAQLALAHVEALARRRPELADWCERADAIRYARGVDSELEGLVREGWERLR